MAMPLEKISCDLGVVQKGGGERNEGMGQWSVHLGLPSGGGKPAAQQKKSDLHVSCGKQANQDAANKHETQSG